MQQFNFSNLYGQKWEVSANWENVIQYLSRVVNTMGLSITFEATTADILSKLTNESTKQNECNTGMSKVRIGVEWVFGVITNFF